jgi:tetratricopeptide (TPR) repeat protein
MSTYPNLFREYITESLKFALAMVQSADSVLPEDERRQMLHTLRYALDLPDVWANTGELILACTPQFERTGNWDEWMDILELAIVLSRAANDQKTEAHLHLQLGILRQLCSQYAPAQEGFLAAADRFMTLNDHHHRAKALNRAAAVATSQRCFDDARRWADAAFELLDEDEPEIAQNYAVRGFLAYDEHRWKAALLAFEQALKIWEKVGDERMIGFSLINSGTAYKKLARLVEAETVYKRAITLFEQIGDSYHHALACNNLGNVLLSRQQPLHALDYFRSAEKTFRKVNAVSGLALTYNNQGVALRELARFEESEQVLQAAVDRWESLNNPHNLIETLIELSHNYHTQGQKGKREIILRQALHHLDIMIGEPGYDDLAATIATELNNC